MEDVGCLFLLPELVELLRRCSSLHSNVVGGFHLKSTKGPWFFDDGDYPTSIDFLYVSHVERMLASCAYWKGLNLRDPKWKLDGLNAWLEAFEKREYYLAFKSDYYTHVKDIPPQYGPGYKGGFEKDRQGFSASINGEVSSMFTNFSSYFHLLDLMLFFFGITSNVS